MSTTNTMSKIKFSLEALVSSVTARATKGVLILVLDDKNVQGLYTYKKLNKVTDNWEAPNKAYITKAFSDYSVQTVMVASAHIGDTSGTTAGADNISNSLSTALSLLNKVFQNGWLVAPQATNETDKATISTFIKTQRSNSDYPIKGVIYNHTSDSEGIVNFTGASLTYTSGSTTTNISSDDYTVDVASVLCTLGANESITNYVAKNITSCDVKSDEDVSVSNGELFLYNNGSNIVFSRGVNSKQTFSSNESNALSKIRVIEVIDMIKSDMRLIFNSTYLGKVGNSYANRKTLISTLNTYLKGVTSEGYLSNDDSSYCILDVNATRTYLESLGTDTDDMIDNDILKAKIDSHIFIQCIVYIMDVIEDINIVLQYET